MADYRGEASITIQAPVEAVYAYLADFTRHPEWVRNVSKVTQVSPGPAGVGTVFKSQEGAPPLGLGQRARMMRQFLLGVVGGAKPYSEAKITALEPPRRIAWQAGIPRGEGFFNFAEWEFLLAPAGSATHLTQRFNYQPQNPTATRMVEVAGVEGLRSAVAVSLAELKRRLEARATERS